MKPFHIILLLVAFLSLSSCEKEEPIHWPSTVDPKEVRHVILIYAVNHSSLSNDFTEDSAEMAAGVATYGCSDSQVLVYQTDSESETGLYRFIINKEGASEKQLVASYPRTVTATHPDRINKVLSDVAEMYPNSKRDLIFWGHGTSWKPFFSDHTVKNGSPIAYAYGGEYNSNGYTTDWTEIDDLASAVPDDTFDLIWFDCCYMAGIETIWEFKEKCRWLVAYPTEVWGSGADYASLLPLLMHADHDLERALRSFYASYASMSQPVTVSLFDMTHLDDLAAAVRNIVHAGSNKPDLSNVSDYSRDRSIHFYDFRQLMAAMATANGRTDLLTGLDTALASAVPIHAESPFDFNMKPWADNSLCGVSSHYFQDLNTASDRFYRTLSWYKYVYE